MFFVKRKYFNKTYIIKGLITACFLSAFIYLFHFGYQSKILYTILGLIGIYLFLRIERGALFFAGFFTAIFWFYWVAISFQYYNLTYLGPFIVIIFGIIYGVLFYLSAIINELWFRILTLFLFSFVHPFGFNWFIPELVFIDSYFPISKTNFAIILISIFIFVNLKRFKFLAFIPLLFIYSNTGVYINNPNLKIDMPQLNIPQSTKWDKEKLQTQVEANFKLIDEAIKNNKELIILPETVFPLVLNKENFIFHNLQKKAEKINIILGSIFLEDNHYYNVTYHFSKHKVEIAKKLVLVPFGEKIPLPKFLVDIINNVFYNGAEDFQKATTPTDFEIDGIKFRNAICYEATSKEVYKNLNGVNYMIATSNNAWFTPSIEPTLQKLLLKYYSQIYDITIFHSINGSENYIIRP